MGDVGFIGEFRNVVCRDVIVVPKSDIFLFLLLFAMLASER
jgi:hypothetical protein